MSEKIEIYSFPKDEETIRMLYWMGSDYTVKSIFKNFRAV